MINQAMIEQYKRILGLESLPLAWTEQEVAQLGIRSIHSLRRDRVTGGGIPFVKTKGAIRYLAISVLEFLHNNLKTSTSSPDADTNQIEVRSSIDKDKSDEPNQGEINQTEIKD